ncbi:hypothetical protein ACFXG6_31835 [Streptomyces roseus]|uniref:hypothetical protein n=1 Tax=Streptomyces roseus TaxID=66430 RepID=UPI0036C555A6
MYEYTTEVLAGTEDYSLWGVPIYKGWYDADGNPCTMREYTTGPDGNPVPRDPNKPPPVHRP